MVEPTFNSQERGGAVVINGILVHPDDSFSIAETAAVLRRSGVTVYRMVKSGMLSPVFRASGKGKLTVWGKAIITVSKLQQVEREQPGGAEAV